MHGQSSDQQAGSLPVPASPDPDWWSVFGDPELTAIEARLARSNLSVRQATYRLVESRAQREINSANLYPMLNATASYTRESIPSQFVKRLGSTSPGLGQLFGNGYNLPPIDLWRDAIDASYELDLWGQVRRTVEAADAQVEASADSRRSALISAEAEVARDYMQLRGLQEQLRIQRANLDTDRQSLVLSRQRFTGGLVTDLDVENASSQVATTESQIPNFQQQIDQQVNAISLLLGGPPQALAGELDASASVPPVPPEVPVGLPSGLVLRRPDIRQAAASLHAATAQIGVAVASFYPQVTLTGNLSEIALQFRDLFTWNSAYYALGPSITLPIFQGGKLRGQLRLNKAQQAEAAVNYEQTVLQAWQDVDNALTAYSAEQLRRDQLKVAVTAARRALGLAQDQYGHGLATFLNVLDAERTLLSAQQQLVISTTTVSSNLVQLYTALGGGWERVYPANDLPPDGLAPTQTASLNAVSRAASNPVP